jgi:hypothetical protein
LAGKLLGLLEAGIGALQELGLRLTQQAGHPHLAELGGERSRRLLHPDSDLRLENAPFSRSSCAD